jgi:hypothetical protein
MELTKYKITTAKNPGYMMVVYQDNHFKSCLNEFKPPLTETQLNLLLNHIPDDHAQLQALVASKFGSRVTVERVKAVGEEPAAAEDYPVNLKIALWCELYENAHNVKYKTGPAEAGKLKALVITPDELRFILGIYMASDEWFLKPKSISNFIKKFNEVRAVAYATPKKKAFPLPYSASYYNSCTLMDKRAYHAYLKENGYEFQHNSVRGGEWKLKQTLN